MTLHTKQLILFTVTVIILSALIWSMTFIFEDLDRTLIITLGTFVPSIMGVVFARAISRQSLRALIKSSISVKLGWVNYGLIFTVLPGIVIITYGLMRVLGYETPAMTFRVIEFPIVFVYILLLMGPLGEELGWRGVLLPSLMKKMHLITSGIIIGVIWALWHLPLFFIEGALQQSFVESYGFIVAFSGYLYYTVVLSLFMTMVFVRTKHSVFSALLIHTVANMSIGVMPLVFTQAGALIQLGVMSLVVLILLVLNRKLILNYQS